MSDFMEIDPISGIRSDFKWNENDQEYTIVRTADVEPVLDFTKAVANEVGINREDIQKGWWLYAKIPPIVEVQMRAKGIHVGNPDHHARMLAEINTHYPYLKTTTGNDGGRAGKVITFG
jgi:hypothetical protein